MTWWSPMLQFLLLKGEDSPELHRAQEQEEFNRKRFKTHEETLSKLQQEADRMGSTESDNPIRDPKSALTEVPPTKVQWSKCRLHTMEKSLGGNNGNIIQ